MENLYGFSNSKGPKHSNLSPTHNFAMMNPYYQHLDHVVDQYLSTDVNSTALRNLNPNLRYLQSGRSEHKPSVGYMYHHGSSNSSIESRMELPQQPRSPFRYGITPVKVEEDVVVLDGDIVNSLPVERSRSSSLSSLTDSSGSSSSGGKSYKSELCLSYMQNSGFCRYGTKCQFAHGIKEMHPVPFSYKSMVESPCKNYSLSGTCSYGSKCRFLHHETSTSPSSTTRTISQIKPDEAKPDEPTSSIVNLKSSNWSPADDDIEIQLNQDFDSYINKVLYGPRRTKRLPAFTKICQDLWTNLAWVILLCNIEMQSLCGPDIGPRQGLKAQCSSLRLSLVLMFYRKARVAR